MVISCNDSFTRSRRPSCKTISKKGSKNAVKNSLQELEETGTKKVAKNSNTEVGKDIKLLIHTQIGNGINLIADLPMVMHTQHMAHMFLIMN